MSGLESLDTCSQPGEAGWEIVRSLGQLASQGRVGPTDPLRLILASHLNTALLPLVSGLQSSTSTSSIPPTSSSSLARSTASLVAGLDWTSRLAVLSDPEFSRLVGTELARSDVCVLDTEAVPNLLTTKDSYTRLLSELTEAGVDRLVVAADGADIARLVENIYQLNLNMSVLALPWDGPVKEMPATDSETVDIIQLVQQFSHMPELVADLGLETEHVMTWEVVRSLYGLLVEGEVGVDSDTVRAGLELTRQTEKFSVERLSGSAGWRTVGAVEGGQLRWAGLEPLVTARARQGEVVEDCENCQCVNGLARPALAWRSEAWLTGLVSVAGLGLTASLLLAVFLCSQCGQVLEGSQLTSFCLLAATSLLFLSLGPFCLLPHSLVCALRELGPPLVSSLVMSVMLSRALLLATADTDGLPGHASGALQVVLGLLLLGVEVAVILVLSLVREDQAHSFTLLVTTGRVRRLQCSQGGRAWLLTMAWPALLLLLQLGLSPAIWRSRRNYREGALFSLASLALCLVSAGWAAVYWVCSDLYGGHWEEISTAAGLVASAATILLVIFLPKVSLVHCPV